MKIRNLAITAALATALTASAVPAKPGFRTITQPDGSKVSLQLVGDEFSHHYVTTDGIAVLRNGDGYFFASVQDDGMMVPSLTLAADPDMRNPQQQAFVSAIDGDKISDALVQRSNTSPLRQAAPAKRAINDNGSNGIGLYPDASFPLQGVVKSIVILVQYTDVEFSLGEEETREYFTNLLMQEGFSDHQGTGSAHDYYYAQSMGQFDPQFDLYGPITLPHERAYYGGNDTWGSDKRPHLMVSHACEILKETVDFSQYDLDQDGEVDNVFVYYAGVGEAQSGEEEAVWPHSWYVSAGTGGRYGYKVADGLYVDRYACSNELLDNVGTLDGIGTFVHEFSHVLGLPDLYNTVSTSYVTPCEFDLMDIGCYNNNSRTPSNLSIFERNALGWANITPITESFEMELLPLADSNHGYIINTDNENEYFLFEYRTKEGWDKYIPGSGMLVWHIDYDYDAWWGNSVNNDGSHQRVDLIEACNRTYTNASRMDRYPFPGYNNVTEFSAETKPALVDWNKNSLGVAFTDITETDTAITATVTVEEGSGDEPGDNPGEDPGDNPGDDPGEDPGDDPGEEDGLESVQLGDNIIRIDGLTINADCDIVVTDMLGRRIAYGNGSVSVPAPGLYIVSTPTHTAKLSIK